MGRMKQDSINHRAHGSQEMTVLISRYRASGLGLERFAQEQGIPYGRLHYWLYQKRRAKAPKPPTQTPTPVFHEVRLTSSLPVATGWAAEISLPGGLAIRFSAAASPGWIGSVVSTLQEPC